MNREPYVLATRSTHKAGEIIELLAPYGVPLITLADLAIVQSPDEEHIEVFDTFRGNALAKARYFARLTDRAVIADDSGIMFDALDGAPGVLSRRFSGRTDLDGDALDRANNQLAVERLANATDRTAHYMCVAALALPDGATRIAIGSCSGTFVPEPRGDGGFGYDPHFLVDRADRTFGELDAAAKQQLSHRARAFRALAPLL